MDLGHKVEQSHCLPVRLVKLMLRRHDRANRLFQPLIFGSLVGEPDGVQVVCIFQITHSRKRDVHNSINVVISFLHFGA